MGDNRKHSPEFRAEIGRRMLAGECVQALSQQHKLARSMMYRWRDAYRRLGAAGVAGAQGRRTDLPKAPAPPAANAGSGTADSRTEEQLRRRIAELERKVGQQACEIDFFKGVFKRLEELPKAKRPGGDASTRKSGA